MTKIGFIGAGNMAFALAKSVNKSKLASKLVIFDINKGKIDLFKKELNNVLVKNSNKEVVDDSDIIFIAVKPQVIDSVLDEIKDTDKLIISIAAGIKINKLESKLKNARIVRVMPNTPCLVGQMAAGFSTGDKVTAKDAKIVGEILSSAGKALLMKESQLDAVTGLSGSGPAFVARLIEAMTEGGIKSGLSHDVALELAIQTFKGTATLLEKTGMSPEELVKMVSSPGGTTVAGREILEKSDVKDILIKTIQTATKRSKELGK